MKRYLVFSGFDYSAAGGAEDLSFTTNNLNEAVEKAESIEFGKWAHIYDCEKGAICFKFEPEPLRNRVHIPRY